MKIKGILFDVNGTLVDIHTDENHEEIYRGISHFLTYHGIYVSRWEVRDEYFRLMDEQRKASSEVYPEFDAVRLWREFLRRKTSADAAMNSEKLRWIPQFLAQMYRGLSRFRLQLYPEVKNVLENLTKRFRLGALSDAQSAWAIPEMKALGIDGYFSPIVVSGDLGFRKPDKRIFGQAIKGLGIAPQNLLFVGNDMYRDIFGARECGLTTVFFSSNQGRKTYEGVEPDYIIYQFSELLQAVDFFQNR